MGNGFSDVNMWRAVVWLGLICNLANSAEIRPEYFPGLKQNGVKAPQQAQNSNQAAEKENNLKEMQCEELICETIFVSVDKVIPVTHCNNVYVKEECSDCTTICFPMSEDQNCDPEKWCPPNCQKMCNPSSCMREICEKIEEKMTVQVPMKDCKLKKLPCKTKLSPGEV